jgi:hypothetical protein
MTASFLAITASFYPMQGDFSPSPPSSLACFSPPHAMIADVFAMQRANALLAVGWHGLNSTLLGLIMALKVP